jgi:formate hydrogenlyase transcriptional activator
MLDMPRASDASEERMDGFEPGEVISQHNFEDIVGRSRALRAVLSQVEIVAPTESTVLILGETGTGKELIARAIHNFSSRQGRPLVKLNSAAIPSGLLESELFGHEKGAFTGAIAPRIGRFELAHGGTLFLDEVGDIPLEIQPKLLRVLQEQEFERLGSTRTMRVDVRVIAATNTDLEQKLADKQFRDDLYYRLNVFPILIPPLRDRREDIPVLVRHFVQKYGHRMKKEIETIPTQAMKALSEYDWPGNIRELENFIERLVILSRGAELELPLSELAPGRKFPAAISVYNFITLEEAQRGHIVRTLKDTNWVIGGPAGAAARLGTKRTTLQYRMKKLGIIRPN